MKKILRKILVTIGVVLYVALICYAGHVDFESQPLPRSDTLMTLYSVDRDGSSFIDRDGNIWEVYDVLFQYTIGSQFMVRMDRHGTVNYEDDTVVSFKYVD